MNLFGVVSIFFALEFGYIPASLISTYESDIVQFEKSGYYVEMESDIYLWNTIYIGGNVKTFTLRRGINSYFPWSALYGFRCGIEIKPVKIGFRHYCYHPIVPFAPFTNPNFKWEGGYEEFFVRVEIKR